MVGVGDAEEAYAERMILRRDGIRCRPLSPLDAEDIRQACNDEQIQAWLPLPSPYGLADARSFISGARCDPKAHDEAMTFAVERDDPSPGRLLGCLGLDPISVEARIYQIGYWVSPWARGERVAARATRAVAEWAVRVRGVERVELRIQPGNTASEAVARACGFTYEGTLRSAGLHRDRRIDLAVYSLLPLELAGMGGDGA